MIVIYALNYNSLARLGTKLVLNFGLAFLCIINLDKLIHANLGD
jgi:hypothetical protein